MMTISEHSTATDFFFFLVFLVQGSHKCLVKNILHPLLCESRALNIGDSSKLTGKPLALLSVHWLLRFLLQVSDCSRIGPEVHLSANEQEGRLAPVLLDLGHPLLPHIVVRVGVDDGARDP